MIPKLKPFPISVRLSKFRKKNEEKVCEQIAKKCQVLVSVYIPSERLKVKGLSQRQKEEGKCSEASSQNSIDHGVTRKVTDFLTADKRRLFILGTGCLRQHTDCTAFTS